MQILPLSVNAQTRCFVNVQMIVRDDPGEIVVSPGNSDEYALWPKLDIGIVEV